MNDWIMKMIQKGYGLPPLDTDENYVSNTVECNNSKLLNAENAKKISIFAAKEKDDNELNNILKKIKRQSQNGYTQCICDYISDLNVERLMDLGYIVNSYVTMIGNIFEVKW